MKKCILICVLFVTPFISIGQKVALVLSGGGAKGIAHLGVIKALEEHNIPIDYVVGTSMGGIVAGCYAAGYSVDSVESIVLSNNFQRWVNGQFEPDYGHYFNKKEDDGSFFSLKLTLDSIFNAAITSTLASDLSLNFALAERFAKASAKAQYDFDSLLVPTRIIASDIFTQREVAIDSGSLGSAIRTSLSVPFFYRPIRFNDKYLFDGGIYNNFPVDVAIREFNPDIVIGVNVSSKVFQEYPRDKDDELLNSSLLFMLLDKSNPDRIPDTGIYIEPDISDYTALDFNKAQALVDSGYSATLKLLPEIKSKIKRTVSQEQMQLARSPFHNGREVGFSKIQYHGFNSKQRKYLNKVFHYRTGETLSMEQIKRSYFKLVSEDYFSTIYPDITEDEETSQYKLQLFGRPHNNFNVDVGGVLASRNISHIFLGLEHYYFDKFLLNNQLSVYSGTFYKSAQLKTRMNLPFFNQFYIESELTYNKRDFLEADDIVLGDREPTILDRTDRKYGINIGFPIGSKFKAVAHASWVDNVDKFSNTSNFTSIDTLDVLKLDGIRVGITVDRNSLNRKQYASAGKSFKLSLNLFDINENYTPGTTSERNANNTGHDWFRVRLTAEQYFKYGRYSSGYYFDGVLSNQRSLSNLTSSLLNASGIYPIMDSQTLFLQNFRANNFLSAGFRNVIALRANLDFRLETYAFKPFNSIDFSSPLNNDKFRFAGTVGFVLHSRVGPISLSANYYDDNETKFGVLAHAGFLLFRSHSME